MTDKRKPTSFSLSEKGLDLLQKIADHHGSNKTRVIEMLARKEARELGLE